MDTKDLAKRLEQFPKLTARIKQLFVIAENENGSLILVVDEEDRVIEAGRSLTQEALQT